MRTVFLAAAAGLALAAAASATFASEVALHPTKLQLAAVADASRPKEDVQRDAQRKPADMLAFAGVKPGDKVAEYGLMGLVVGGGLAAACAAAAVPSSATRGSCSPSRHCGAIAIGVTAGGSGSMTGAGPAIPVTGTRHSKASRRPLGDTGSQRSETWPSAVHAGSGAALSARAIHSRARPSSLCSARSSSAINSAMRLVGAAR